MDPERQGPEQPDLTMQRKRDKKQAHKLSVSANLNISGRRQTRECRRYVKEYQNFGAVNGRWTREEHQQFLESMRLYGKDWKRIEEHVGSRTCSQIRSHAQKYFLRMEKENDPTENGNLEGTFDSSRSHDESQKDEPLSTLLTGKRKTDSQIAQIQLTM